MARIAEQANQTRATPQASRPRFLRKARNTKNKLFFHDEKRELSRTPRPPRLLAALHPTTVLLLLFFTTALTSCTPNTPTNTKQETAFAQALAEHATLLEQQLQNKAYENAYELFAPELKAKRSAKAFAAYLRADPRWKNKTPRIVATTLVNETTAYVIINLTLQTNENEPTNNQTPTSKHDASASLITMTFQQYAKQRTDEGHKRQDTGQDEPSTRNEQHPSALTYGFFGLQDAFLSSCPVHCADGNPCTKDVCNESTNFTCTHALQTPCLGNGVCEQGEYPSPDCPLCRDFNPCTSDTYNVFRQQCEHTPLTPCCGNHLCEEGEDASSCKEDCTSVIYTLARGEAETQTMKGEEYTIKLISISLPHQQEPQATFLVNDERYTLPRGSRTALKPGIFLSFDFLTQATTGPVAALSLYEDNNPQNNNQ
ncbi:hypothetical protein D6783_03485 [Candidatus Woesearchaeota archaeon]|nr:MAG: hypothetical protein D6783_03485 [Candidatus Woesearchaeota archaeon]